MRRMSRGALLGWAFVSIAGAAAQVGCGDSSSATTEGTTSTSGSGGSGAAGGGGASSSSGGGGSGAAGGTGGAGATGGSGGSGGAGAGLPFTSEGASSYETEGVVAANGEGDVVAAWLAFFADNTSAIGYAVSHDGGELWTAPAYVESPNGLYASAPVVVADAKKRFTLGWAAFGPDFAMPDEHIYTARMEAGSDTFGDPIVASDDGTSKTRDFDKPWLAVDANDETLATWADFTDYNLGAPASLTFARSADGKTFQTTTVTNDATFGNLAYPCLDRDLGPTAPLYMVHLGGGLSVTLRKSIDQGKTWAIHDVPAMDVRFQDVTCVVHGDDVWVAWGSGMAQFVPGQTTPADAVEVAHSSNGGEAFDPPVTVTAGPLGKHYMFPQLARTAGGKLAVVYYRGNDGDPNELVLATSSDGTTWSESTIATPGTFILDRTLANWLGDYMGIAAAGETLMFAFADNTAGKSHVAFTKMTP